MPLTRQGHTCHYGSTMQATGVALIFEPVSLCETEAVFKVNQVQRLTLDCTATRLAKTNGISIDSDMCTDSPGPIETPADPGTRHTHCTCLAPGSPLCTPAAQPAAGQPTDLTPPDCSPTHRATLQPNLLLPGKLRHHPKGPQIFWRILELLSEAPASMQPVKQTQLCFLAWAPSRKNIEFECLLWLRSTLPACHPDPVQAFLPSLQHAGG